MEAIRQESISLHAEHETAMKKLKQDRLLWEKQKKTMILPTQRLRELI